MVNLEFLEQMYFCFDSPVPYSIGEEEIFIYPVLLKNSLLFLSSVPILTIEKNNMPDANIIQMSYLQFIDDVLLKRDDGELYAQELFNILHQSLHIKNPAISKTNDGKYFIIDTETQRKINQKQFDEIKMIILHQNLLHYDDEYINPELKQAMEETDSLKNKKYEMPSLERKIAIISAHCGITKQNQLNMTYRSHCQLWDEVCGEIEFMTTRSIALFSGSADKIEHWIFKNKKNKYQEYFTSVNQYTKNTGNIHQMIKTTNNNLSEQYLQQFNNFK